MTMTREEALEQESLLDKIRAEITVLDDDYEGYYKAITDVLQIIDKYRAGSEDTFSDYPDMPYQFDNMTGSMNL